MTATGDYDRIKILGFAYSVGSRSEDEKDENANWLVIGGIPRSVHALGSIIGRSPHK